ncbi:Imm52 family immunity protein [Gimesia maris]|uniref:Imm52 family immunity protein n=1 Tax=Gimesia maris TaxID=122 RepID=UPI0030D73516|tara:strand:+ start:800 stop:1525 length:726 start_codon:yes stop_codon:yes gene_type:complete
MQNDKLAIYLGWKQREDSLDESVVNILESLKKFEKLSNYWHEWFKSYHTIADWEKPAKNVTEKIIRNELINGQVVNPDGSCNTNLGYRIRVWSGPEKGTRFESTEFEVQCCRKLPKFINTVTLQLPSEGEYVVALSNVELLLQVADELIEIWNPAYLNVRYSGEIVKRVLKPGPLLGCINYLTGDIGTIEKLPDQWNWGESLYGHQIFFIEGGVDSLKNKDYVHSYQKMSDYIEWNRDWNM